MDDFLTTNVEPQFLGSGWQANWSNATDQQIVSRIALNETTETSVSANHDGIRKLAMAAAIVTNLFSSNLSTGAQGRGCRNARSPWSARPLADLGQVQSETGIVQKRVSDASDRMKTQVDLFERHIIDLEGVDPYEAATRVNDLMSAHRDILRADGAHPATQPVELPDLITHRNGSPTCINSPTPTSRPTPSPTRRTVSGSC